MRFISRMNGLFLAALFLVMGAGCGEMPSPFAVKDRSPRSEPDAPFDPPNTYPEWAYDAPQYMRPAQELVPEPRVNPADPLHYFTNQKVVLIRRPEGYTPEELPRVAIWWTDNNGFHWSKAGYYGRQQAFFPFEVEEDGDYGIRFVGPGQEPAMHSLPYPQRVYHVDTVLPEVEVFVEPEKTWYHVGEAVTIYWRATDYHLVEYPVRIGMLYDFSAPGEPFVEIQRDLPDEGTISFTLPQETLDHEVRFRVEAMDRAGNLGIAISFALQVVPGEADYVSDLMEPERITDAGAVVVDRFDTFDWTMPPTGDSHDEPLREPHAREQSPRWSDEDQSEVDELNVIDDFATASLPAATLAARAADPEAAFQWTAGSTGTGAGARPSRIGQPDEHRVGRPMVAANVSAHLSAPVHESPSLRRESPFAPTTPRDATAGEAPPDEDGPFPRRETGVYQGLHPATPDAVSSLEPTSVDQLRAAAAERRSNSLAAIGVTHSDGLLVPFPATVEPERGVKDVILAHPWRTLQGFVPLAVDTVWTLPRPRFDSEDINRLLDGSYLAEGRFWYPVSEPAAIGRTVVSVPDATLGAEAGVQP